MGHIFRCHDVVKTDFVRGENCYLYDTQGRRFVDLESGIWSTIIGHSHPRVNQVIRTQIEKVIHLGTRYPSVLADEAATAVLDIVGLQDGKCVFLSSGSEAVEFAVQIARCATEKPLCLAFSNAYLAAYGSSGGKRADEWWLLDWATATSLDLDELLAGIPFERIGAFVFEPGGSGSSFVRFPPVPLVQAIARRIRQEQGLVVVNEVTTGMGRTGRWFGFQHYGITPDIVALGKGLGNGYPVSVVAMRRDLGDRLEVSGYHYAQSHQNDPLGCAVAKEVIAVLRDGQWMEAGNAIGVDFLEGLKALVAKHAIAREARGRGMLLGLELYPNGRVSVQSIYEQLLERGFLVGYYVAGNVLRFDPALTIDRADITDLLDALDGILSETP